MKKKAIAVIALALCAGLCIAAAAKWPRAEVSGQSAGTEPNTAEPGAPEPEPTAAEPDMTEPGDGDPGTREPGTADPGTTKKEPDDPVITPGNILPFRERSVGFRAQYVRTDGYHADARYPRVTVIHSAEELNAYYEANRDLYYMDSFKTACERYDEAYFADRILLVVLVEAGSGSVRYQVSNVELARVNGDELTVTVDVLAPEAGTCDMAEWHILIEPEAVLSVKGEDHVTVNLRAGLSLTHDPDIRQKITEEQAVEIAKNAVTVSYDSVRAWFDEETGAWLVNFYRENILDGDQTVTVDEYGAILGSVYGG